MLKQMAVLAGATWLVGLGSAKAQTSVCVEVELRSWAELDSEARAAMEDAGDAPEDALREGQDGAEDGGQDGAEDGVEGDPGRGAQVPPDAHVVRALPPGRQAPAQAPAAQNPSANDRIQAARLQAARQQVARRQAAQAQTQARAAQQRQQAARRQPAFAPPHYLRRLIEYRVTHMPGFEAVRESCAQHLVVQLYPLPEGWTAFARYDGTSREEKVDRVQVDEFPALAARLTEALLTDQALEETLSRRTVLRADSEEEMRRVRGRTQVRFSIGTQLILGLLPTARSIDQDAEHQFRVSAPLALEAGARTTYRAWALDAYLGMMVGTSRQSVSGSGRGHADYTFGMTAALHFLRYISPDAAASLYGGGGASFQIHRYRILPGASAGSDEGLVGGGLNLDLVLGYEVMRASALSFFVEVQALLPAYGFDSENRNGAINAWLPAGVVQIGLLR